MYASNGLISVKLLCIDNDLLVSDASIPISYIQIEVKVHAIDLTIDLRVHSYGWIPYSVAGYLNSKLYFGQLLS